VARATVQKGSALEGRTVAWVENEIDLTVVLHEGQDAIDPHPGPDVTLHAGDCLVVFASLESLARLRQMSGGVCAISDEKTKGPRQRRWLMRLLSK
jgi:Trk K+ transport system NAD-binding subunit